MTFTTTFKGLEIHYEVSPYTPATYYRSNGDPGDPAEGGECETWYIDHVDDVEEFIEHLREEIAPRKLSERIAFGVMCWWLRHQDNFDPDHRFRVLRHAIRRIKDTWADDIEQHCTAHYWEEIGPYGDFQD